MPFSTRAKLFAGGVCTHLNRQGCVLCDKLPAKLGTPGENRTLKFRGTPGFKPSASAYSATGVKLFGVLLLWFCARFNAVHRERTCASILS